MTLPKGHSKGPRGNVSLLYNKNLLLQTESDLERVSQESIDKGNKRKGKDTKIGAMIGLGLGIAAAEPTFGASLLVAPAFGAAFGKWIGKKIGNDLITQQELESIMQAIQQLRLYCISRKNNGAAFRNGGKIS